MFKRSLADIVQSQRFQLWNVCRNENTDMAAPTHPRTYASCAYVPWGGVGKVIIVGGLAGPAPAEIYDLAANTWTEVDPSNNVPGYQSINLVDCSSFANRLLSVVPLQSRICTSSMTCGSSGEARL